jgi:hypothetical protein
MNPTRIEAPIGERETNDGRKLEQTDIKILFTPRHHRRIINSPKNPFQLLELSQHESHKSSLAVGLRNNEADDAPHKYLD